MSDDDYLLPNPPIRFSITEFNRLLLHLDKLESSDVHLTTLTQVYADLHGRLKVVVDRPLSHNELEEIINGIYGANGAAQIASGTDIDTSYEIKDKEVRGKRLRFRINAVGCLVSGRQGIQITARSIPVDPPSTDMIGFSDSLWGSFAPSQGMVLVTGPTGSGKSTLLAASIRKLLEEADGNRKFVTFESPIEFVYDSVVKPSSLISQTEIPRHLPTFAAGVRNALRRKPAVILIGESRDTETIEASIEAAQTGHLVYSTTHTNGVAETVQRMIMAFPAAQRAMVQVDMLNVLRLIVTQRLVRTLDGKRMPLREWLVIDGEVREELINTPSTDLVAATRRLVEEKGQTMLVSAKEAFDAGKISDKEYNDVRIGYG